MKIIFMFLIFFTLMIMLTKHPLSMGCALLMETILASLMCSLNMSTYLLSYILFLIFIGGMLILFMYMYLELLRMKNFKCLTYYQL